MAHVLNAAWIFEQAATANLIIQHLLQLLRLPHRDLATGYECRVLLLVESFRTKNIVENCSKRVYVSCVWIQVQISDNALKQIQVSLETTTHILSAYLSLEMYCI